MVGGVGGALLIAVLAWLLLRRRNKSKRHTEKSEDKREEQSYEKPELDGKHGVGPSTPWLSNDSKDGSEMHGKPMHEMAGSNGEYELPAKSLQRYEMAAH